VKARKVKQLDPAGALADNAERIVRARLDEMCGFMPRAADPAEVVALHDMRIAAKRLRYILEVTGPAFGAYARTAVRMTKDLQDLLGEIHDCDVQIPEVSALLEHLVAEDASVLATRAGGADDLAPGAVRRAPHRADYAGLMALIVHLRARRDLLFARFLELWRDYERKGYRARLEFAVSERSEVRPPPLAAPAAEAIAGDGASLAEAPAAAPAEPDAAADPVAPADPAAPAVLADPAVPAVLADPAAPAESVEPGAPDAEA
jgi:hypothetical protein